MPKMHMITVTAAAALLVAGCGGDNDEPQPVDRDPYEVYQEIKPDDAVELSREDAQTRAMLGCDQDWAPGTVDAALAEAYVDLCDRMR